MGDVEDTIRWFDREAEAYAKRTKPDGRLAQFTELLAPGSRVLDAGAGPGVDADEISVRGHDVVALDAAPGMVAIARRQFPGLHVIRGDLRALPFESGSFDGALALFVLMFLPDEDIRGVLRSLARLLVRGGALLVAVQGPPCGQAAMMRAMTMDEIAGTVTKAGFSVLQRFDRPPRPDEVPHRKLHVLARRA
jgi:SAM-dependent methyltransferase